MDNLNFQYENDRIFMTDENGKVIAEIDFPLCEDGVRNINHTFVGECLRGQGVAGKLMDACVKKISENGEKIIPTCSYAAKWFEKHSEYSHLLK